MSVAVSILFAVASMLGFGFADFIAKAVLAKASPYRTVLVSQCVGTVPFLGIALAYDLAVPSASLLFLTAISGVLSTIALFCFYKALSVGKASLVSPVSSCMTVVAVVLSVLILRETLTAQQSILIATVSLGILFVAIQTGGTKSKASNLSILLSLVVAFVAGSNAIAQKWIAISGHYLLAFLLSRFFMLGFLAALFPMFGKETRLTRAPTSYVRMAVLGIIDVSGFFAWFMALREGFVSIVTPIATSAPAVTIILAHMFLGERVLLHQKIGVITIILGIAVLSAVS